MITKQIKNDNFPLITVAIPTYNNPSGLKDTLRFITQQTYKNLEIIVSDNCSSGDETKKVVKEFIIKDKRVKYFRHKENILAWPNFISTLDKAKGKYFMWAGDDDEWLPNYIESCMNVLLNKKSLDMVFTEYKFLSAKGGFFYNYHPKINFNFFSKLSRIDALSLFILMDDSTNKAIVILGLWKKSSLSKVMETLPILYEKYKNWKGLDVSIVVYALAKINFYQIPKKLFIKKYGPAAPGSLINRASGIKSKFVNLFFKPGNFVKYYKNVHNINMTQFAMVKYALKLGGVDDKLQKTLFLKHSFYYLPLELRALISSLIVFFLYSFYKLKYNT